MDFDNQVVTGNSNPLLSQSNAGKTKHYGLEGSLGLELGGGFSLDSNLTCVPVSEFTTVQYNGNRLPYAPKFLANAALNYQQGKLSSSLMAHYRGEQYGDPANTKEIPTGAGGGIWGGKMSSYTVYDLTSRYQVSEQLGLQAAVKNLTDKRYIAGMRQGIYVGPERSFEVAMNYKF